MASYFIILIGIGLITGTYIANKASGKKTKTPADTSGIHAVKGCSTTLLLAGSVVVLGLVLLALIFLA